MKNNISLFCCIVLVFFGCSSVSAPPRKPPIRPAAVPESILGPGVVSSRELAAFLLSNNPSLEKQFAEDFAKLYVAEAAIEGINHDVAFSQMCVETGFLTFGGLVTADMNNYSGIGSIGPGQPGERFASPRIGVRAQIQHLKAYATTDPPKQFIVDPRYHLVRLGAAPTIDGLAGTWAADKDYGVKIKTMLQRLYASRGRV